MKAKPKTITIPNDLVPSYKRIILGLLLVSPVEERQHEHRTVLRFDVSDELFEDIEFAVGLMNIGAKLWQGVKIWP